MFTDYRLESFILISLIPPRDIEINTLDTHVDEQQMDTIRVPFQGSVFNFQRQGTLKNKSHFNIIIEPPFLFNVTTPKSYISNRSSKAQAILGRTCPSMAEQISIRYLYRESHLATYIFHFNAAWGVRGQFVRELFDRYDLCRV